MNPVLEVGPILRAMRHHKGAFSLLVLEVALGFVMLTHTLVSIRYYHRLRASPSNMPEDGLIVARRRFVHPRDAATARLTVRADLAALSRAGAPVAAIDVPPLPDAAMFPTALTRPNAPGEETAWRLRATPAIAAALGLHVIAGTDLQAAAPSPDGAVPVLLTTTVAEHMFQTYEGAVGQPIQIRDIGRGRVAGVVRDFAFRGGWVPAPSSTVVIAAEPVTEQGLLYVMHTDPGRRASVVQAATRALTSAGDADSAVVVEGLQRRATRFDRVYEGAVIVLIWTGLLVVAVALAGSLALASFSVAERTRQIGVRRALGANRGEIVRYFLLENLILTSFGLVLGLGLAIGLNHVLRQIMADLRLPPEEIIIATFVFLATGQLSALVPARRAALIPPWAATRTL
ncbi:MAG TPA: FtsX-like permease family protein [Polyangia bacterium]|nr:FtsX-like permease family protein [Polyangia bacterium]